MQPSFTWEPEEDEMKEDSQEDSQEDSPDDERDCEEKLEEAIANYSFDSAGDIVLPRQMHQPCILIPDFLVVQGSGSLVGDKVVVVVEVKSPQISIDAAKTQVISYVDHLQEKQAIVDNILILLIHGGDTTCWRLVF
jgi:hypothetical protein